MKIGVTPVRISFAGGGTDLPEFFNNFGGNVVATTISKFTHVIIHPRFDKSFQSFSPDFQKHYVSRKFDNIEIEDGNEIAASIVKFLKFKKGIDVVLYSDVPGGSGLGASSSLAVNLINVLSKMRNQKWNSKKIAETAFKIERNVLNWPMGKQDEYITSFGGLNFLQFNKNKVVVKKISLNKNSYQELETNLLLFFVGMTRNSSHILSSLITNIKKRNKKTIDSLLSVKTLGLEMYDTLQNSDITKFGELLNKGWIAKKNFSKDVSNSKIDKLYSIAIQKGALGGKLTGAGGGGHLLLYCEKNKQKSVISNMKKLGLRQVDFKFYNDGPKVFDLYDSLNK